MARPSIFVGTPSIFESLRLKQIDLYCKNIITCVLHIDLTLLWYYFLGDQNKYHVTMTSQYLCSTKENAVYSVRCGYQFCSVATEHVEALSARFFTFLWLVTYLLVTYLFLSPFWISLYDIMRMHLFIATKNYSIIKFSLCVYLDTGRASTDHKPGHRTDWMA